MIRPLRPDDATALYELSRRSRPLSCDLFEPCADVAAYRAYTGASADGHHRLVVVDPEGLSGLGILELPSRARLAHVGRIRLMLPLATFPGAAAKELLTALIDLADNWLNLRRLEVDIPANAGALEEMLSQAGFQREGLTRKSLGPGPAFADEIALARLGGFTEGEPLRRPAAYGPKKAERLALADIKIRSMRADDSGQLYEVFRAPENCRTTLQLPSQELWLTQQRVLNPPAGMIRLVADCRGRVLGMISLRPRQAQCRAHIGGIGMMVHPDFWGLGIGSLLMESLLTRAKQELSLARIQLEVHADNAAGIGLYEKFGFVVEGTKHFHSYGDGGWTHTHFMAHLTI